VFVVGGEKDESAEAILQRTRDIMECNAAGWAIGRNIWMNKEPIELAKKIAEILYK